MHRRTRALGAVIGVALPLSALTSCADDGAQRERAVAALKAQMVGNAAMTTGRQLDDEQTTCVAEGAVDTLGVDTLQSYELLTDDLRPGESIQAVELEPADADALAQSFADCMDVERLMERQIISGLDLPPRRERAASRCVRQEVESQDVVETLSLEFQGAADNPVFDELLEQLQGCLR